MDGAYSITQRRIYSKKGCFLRTETVVKETKSAPQFTVNIDHANGCGGGGDTYPPRQT